MSKNFTECPNVFWGVFFERFFCPVFHGVIEIIRKNLRNFKIAEMPRIVPKFVQICFEHVLFWTCFVAIFSKKNSSCSMEGRVFENFQNNQKIFKIPKVPRIVFKSVQTCFEHDLRRFCRIFLPSVPCRAFQIIWTWNKEFRLPKLKNMSWVCRQNAQQSFFCITARVNVLNSISDLLDWKLWVQIPEFKNMSSVFRTCKTWVQFSGLKFWGRDIEKIKEKNQKSFKVPKMSKIVPKSVQTCFEHVLGQIYRKIFFASCSPEGRVFENFQKNGKNSKFQKCPKSFPKVSTRVLNMLCGDFSEFF